MWHKIIVAGLLAIALVAMAVSFIEYQHHTDAEYQKFVEENGLASTTAQIPTIVPPPTPCPETEEEMSEVMHQQVLATELKPVLWPFMWRYTGSQSKVVTLPPGEWLLSSDYNVVRAISGQTVLLETGNVFACTKPTLQRANGKG